MNVKISFIKFLKENGIFSNELEYVMNYYKNKNQLNMKQYITQKIKEISPYFLSNNLFKNFVKNDDKKIISNLIKIFNIYHRNIKRIKLSFLYKWLIKVKKMKINIYNNNNNNKIKSKSHSNILFNKNQLSLNTERLYEDYKFKDLYLNNLNVLNQFKEGEKCSFHPFINNFSNNYYINTLNKNNNNEHFRFNSVNNLRKHSNHNYYNDYLHDNFNYNNSIDSFSAYNQTTVSNYNNFNNKNYNNNKYKKRIYNTITNNNYNDNFYKNNKNNNLIFKNYSKNNFSKNSNEMKKSKLNYSLNDYIYYNKFYDLINKLTIFPKFNNINNNIHNKINNENKGFLTSRISKKKLSNISFNIKDSILNNNNFPPEEIKFKLNKRPNKNEKKILNTYTNNNNKSNKLNKNIIYDGTEDSMNYLPSTKVKNTIGPFNLGTNSNSSFQNNTTNTMYNNNNNNINYNNNNNNNNNYNSHNKKNYLIYEKNLDSIKSKISNSSNYTYSKDENSLEIFDNNKNIKINYNKYDNNNNSNHNYLNNINNQISNENFNIKNNQNHNKEFTETSCNLEVSATYPKVTSINFNEENEKKMFKQADNMLKASDENYSINKFLDSYNKFKK